MIHFIITPGDIFGLLCWLIVGGWLLATWLSVRKVK